MAHSYQVIDEKTWDRSFHCSIFRNSVEPAYCVTFDLDITDFLREIKRQQISFTFAMTYAVCKCANEVEAFRYRFLDGEVILYDQIDTAFTYLGDGSSLFKIVNVPMCDSLLEYVDLAEKMTKEQIVYFTGPLRNDVFQCSSLPWVTYTHISHTNSGKKDNATPLFSWGKYCEKGGRVLIPLSIQAHHSFVDGIHVGMLTDRLKEYMSQFKLD